MRLGIAKATATTIEKHFFKTQNDNDFLNNFRVKTEQMCFAKAK